jgi:3-dehydroquinate dehydratase/shikimate dehydrogenase
MIAEHHHLAEQGAELVELRLDYLKGDVQLKSLLAERPCPIIATCRREKDGGRYSGSEESRQSILRMAIAEGVDYVDLEEDTANSVPRFGSTKRIISLHDFRQTPDDLDQIHQRLTALDPDIIKIATMANSPLDCLRVLRLSQKSRIPTVGICMGEMGTPSRILAGRFGAPFTYATFHHERTLAPGQLSFQEMVETYHYDRINDQTTVFGTIADPVSDRLSPVIFNAAFRDQGLNAVHLPFRLPREHLNEFLTAVPQFGIKALGVAIPHREAVVARLQKVDRVVLDTGAANTLVFSPDGLVGFNTDSRASIDSLEAQLAEGSDFFQGKTALVLGAGSAARGVAYALKRRGANVVVASRTIDRTKQLAEKLDCEAIAWNSRYGVDCGVLVNCTPVGMHPNVDESPFEKHHLKPSMLVFDMVYNPENTLLIKEARSQGCPVVTGVEMFIRHAGLQLKLFTGQTPSEVLMRNVLKRVTGAANY